MNIRQLHTFRIVCETESLTQAARVLNTTQPAISAASLN
ncbi:MAG: LysR family transcriptional regulator [Lachnospiraceae bacterium]